MTRSDKNTTLFIPHGLALIWLFFSCLTGQARALQVTLAWDESPPEERIRSYRLYYGNSSRTYSLHEEVGSRQCSAGVCQHTLELPQGRWYFAVTALNLDGLESGYSQEVFADLYAEPRLVYPKAGGVTWARGCVYEIRWAGFESSSVSLELAGPSGNITLSSSTPNDGSFLFRVRKKHPPGEGYLLRVRGKQLPQEMDESQKTFSILEPLVTAPQEGTVFSRGDLVWIRWNPASFCGDSVSLSLHRGSRRLCFIGTHVPNTGEFSWSLPQQLRPGGRHRVVVRSESHGACRASSPGGFLIQ